MNDTAQWRYIKKSDKVIPLFERFEPSSLAAYSRFTAQQNQNAEAVRTWVLEGPSGKLSGVLLLSGQTLYPVFDSPAAKTAFQIRKMLQKPLEKVKLHAIQGIAEDVELVEKAAAEFGLVPEERTLYDIMVIRGEPSQASLNAGPAGLIVRPPCSADMDSLFRLQVGYEKEEVLTKKSVFSPAACRLVIERIVRNEQILIAEYRGNIAGKINTSAASGAWTQIGGVYVLPEFRGCGIASRMAAVFVQGLLAGGKGVSLFVKKHNAPARAVYRRIGFAPLDAYRISYF